MNKPITRILLLSLIMILLTLISRKQRLLSRLLCLENIILIIITYFSLHRNTQLINIMAPWFLCYQLVLFDGRVEQLIVIRL